MTIEIGPGIQIGAGISVTAEGGSPIPPGSATGGNMGISSNTYVAGTNFGQPANYITIQGDAFFWASSFYEFELYMVPLSNSGAVMTMSYTNGSGNPASVTFTAGSIIYYNPFDNPFPPSGLPTLQIIATGPVTGITGIADETISSYTDITFTW